MSNGSLYSPRTAHDREGLLHNHDVEAQQFGLTDLAEDSEGEDEAEAESKEAIQMTAMNGNHKPKSPR